MSINAIRHMSCRYFYASVAAFSPRYTADWNAWLQRPDPGHFGEILRRWQAVRPEPMRRVRREAGHGSPYLDDLWEAAQGEVVKLGTLGVDDLSIRTIGQDAALRNLWGIFENLTASSKRATCVGISKAVLLATNGQIGPALDSEVRRAAGIRRPTTADEWIRVLEDVHQDIAAFTKSNGPLWTCVPVRFQHLTAGRLYDMALGPR